MVIHIGRCDPRNAVARSTLYMLLAKYLMRSVLHCGFVAAFGCGGMTPTDEVVDCSTTTDVDTFVVGLEHRGVAGKFQFALMAIDPAPAVRGDNTWIVRVDRLTQGAVEAPIDGATISVSPYMPSHMHYTPITAQITPLTGGQYELRPVNLWMPGVWETTIQATSGGDSDRAIYKFCIQ